MWKRLSVPLLAINHHYFRDAGTGRGIYPTTPAMLRAEVDTLRRYGWHVGNQDDVAAFAAGESHASDHMCVLTFDDGLKEQMAAVALLESLGAGALCFVPTAPLVERAVLDVHKLQMIRSRMRDEDMAADLERRFGLADQHVDEELSAIQYRYDSPLGRRIKYFLNFMLDEVQRLDWTRSTFAELFGDERVVADSLYMSADDLRTLARSQRLGSHAHTHRPLATLDRTRASREMEESREILSAVAGVAPIGLSYPYGGKSAVSADVFSDAKRVGYRYGFTMARGINTGALPFDPLALQRIDVNDLHKYVGAGSAGAPEATN